MRTIDYVISSVDDDKTVERYLKSRGFSSSVITDLKSYNNGVLVNGTPVYVISKLKSGDLLTVNLLDEVPSQNILPIDLNFAVLYEDEDYIVYDKPAGVVVHPTKVYQNETLGNDYIYRCMKRGETAVFRPIYRIDRNTSGLVVVAKNKLSAQTEIQKEYLCICSGELPYKGCFDNPIGLCDGSKIKRCLRADGQSAITNFERVSYNGGFSLASVRLLTGRTHQIRTHFSGNGFPLAGDDLYGGDTSDMKRQALHCAKIKFVHIVTGETVSVSSNMPKDMNNFIKKNNISY